MHLKLTAARARGLSFPERAHTPLSLSLSPSLFAASALFWKELCFQLKHRYVASLVLHASIADIKAQLLSLSYALAYLILSEDGTIKNQDFCAD